MNGNLGYPFLEIKLHIAKYFVFHNGLSNMMMMTSGSYLKWPTISTWLLFCRLFNVLDKLNFLVFRHKVQG